MRGKAEAVARGWYRRDAPARGGDIRPRLTGRAQKKKRDP